jgi:glutathione S-transferase
VRWRAISIGRRKSCGYHPPHVHSCAADRIDREELLQSHESTASAVDTGGHGRVRLFSGPLSMFGAKAQIAAIEKGLDFELVMVPFEMKRLYEPKHPEVVRINPKRQVPVLIHGDLEIFDSTQIFEYLEDLKPEPALWPTGPSARARARLIELKSDEVYFPHIIRLMGLQATPDEPAAVAAREAATRFYREMEGVLADREYLAGTYSFADIAFYMAQLFGARMGAPMTEATPKLLAWRDRMTARPAVRQVVGPMVAFLVSEGRPIPDFLSELRPLGGP